MTHHIVGLVLIAVGLLCGVVLKFEDRADHERSNTDEFQAVVDNTFDRAPRGRHLHAVRNAHQERAAVADLSSWRRNRVQVGPWTPGDDGRAA